MFLPQLLIDHEKERARRVQCINNLRQIGLECALYASDNGNRVPRGTSSILSNMKLVSYHAPRVYRILTCPSGNKSSANSFNDTNATDTSNVSYTQQVPLLNSTNAGMLWMANLNDVVFWDQGVAGNACGPDGGVGLSWAKTSNHKGAGGNVLFTDGHVAWYTKTPTNMSLGCLNP